MTPDSDHFVNDYIAEQDPKRMITFGTEWLSETLNRAENYRAVRQLSVNLETGGKHLYGRTKIIDGFLVGQGNMILDKQGRTIPISKLSDAELKAELKAKELEHNGKKKEMYLKVQQSRKQYKKHILTLLKHDSEYDRRRRIRRREFALKQFHKRKILLERKQAQSKLISTLTVKSLRYENNIPRPIYNDNIFLANPSIYVAELLDGLPQSVSDVVSYQVIGDVDGTDYARSRRQLVGSSYDEIDLESSEDIVLLDKALASLQDELTNLGDSDTSSELVSITKRIQNLEQEQEQDSKSNIIFSSPARSAISYKTTSAGLIPANRPDLGYQLLNSLLPYGITPTITDFEILISTIDNAMGSKLALSLAIQLSRHCEIWNNQLSVEDFELLYSRLLKILLDNAEILYAKRVLVLMRLMSIVPSSGVRVLIKQSLHYDTKEL